MKRLSFTKSELFIIVIALLFFFQIYLRNLSGIFNYFDEFVLLILAPQIFKTRKNASKRIAILLILLLLGLISSLYAGIQRNIVPILIDAISIVKVFLIYEESKICLQKLSTKSKMKIIRSIAFFVRIFVVIAFGCGVISLFLNIGMSSTARYGIASYEFINNGPGQLSLMFYYVLFILTLDLKYSQKGFKYIVLALITWSLTLRTRAFAYVVIYLFLYFIIIKRKSKFELNFRTILPLAVAMFLFTYDQIEIYFGNVRTPRFKLLYYGIKTMIDYFPLGSGYATFGTDAAVKFYSPLYLKYGFDSSYGLGINNAKYANDTYWPAIMAEFGVFGVVLIGSYLVLMFNELLKNVKGNYYSYFACLFVCITQISSSIASATFFNFVTASLFFVLPLAIIKE